MKIIGLDISKSSTGAAIGDATEPPVTLSIGFKAQGHGATGMDYMRWLNGLIQIEKPDAVVWEAASRYSNATMNAEVAYLMLGLSFATHIQCEVRGIRLVRTVTCQTWRKAIIGTGYPQNPKQAALDLCDRLGWPHGGVHDRAEAAGIWAWGHFEIGNRAAMSRLMSQERVRA